MADFNEGDVIRLGCVQEFDGSEDIVNVLHVVPQDATFMTFAEAALEFQEYTDALYDIIAASLSELMLPKHISVKNVTRNEVWGNIAWDTYAGGTNVSDPTAPQVCVLGWARTNISRVQMRKYLGVFCEGDMTLGTWTAPLAAFCQDFMSYHILPQTMTGGLILKGAAVRESDKRVTFGVSGTASRNPVIQRRRRRGRGA